jgi:short-subunit dehydrogenase
VACDVRDEASRRGLVQRAIEILGHVDVLINNAGVEEVVHFELQDPEMIRATVETNLLAPMLLTQTLLPHLLERKSGHIVNIASLSGRTGMPYGSAYSGSKAGMCEWGVSLGVEMKDRGLAVTNVIPGFVSETGMHARKGRPAPGSIGEIAPEKVADAVVKALKKKPLEMLVTKHPVKPLIVLKALSTKAALKVGEALGVVSYLRTLADDRAKKDS